MKTLLNLFFLFIIPFAYSQNSIEDYFGTWEVDIEKSTQNAIKEGKMQDGETLPQGILNMMEKFSTEIKEGSFIQAMGERSQEMKYLKTKSNTNNSCVMYLDYPTDDLPDGLEPTLTFSSADNLKTMKMVSSLSNDMNFYIWKKKK